MTILIIKITYNKLFKKIQEMDISEIIINIEDDEIAKVIDIL